MPLDSAVALVDALRQAHLLEPAQLDELDRDAHVRALAPRALAAELIRRGWLTPFQANQLLQGRGGELLLGSYVLVERLGEGGMGAVYKAHNWKIGRVVALKVIRKDRLSSADAVRRFHREIRAASALSHPNVVAAHDADEINGTHFFAMEYVEGSDLAKLIKQHGRLPVEQACEWVRQAAVGLQHAHERGLVHRDIKPHNLLLTKQGIVKILDMGLARLTAEDGEASTTMTQDGAVMGTPDYIAPEQAEESHTVDIRADIYSLGCTLYQLLTGTVPFPGGTLLQKLKKHQSHQPSPLEALRPELSSALCSVVYQMMAKRPEDRYQTPAEVAAALTACVSRRPPAAVPVAAVGRMLAEGAAARPGEIAPQVFDFQPTAEATEIVRAEQRGTEKRRWLLALAGGCLLLLSMATVFVVLSSRREQSTQENPVRTEARVEKHWQPGPANEVLPGLIARPARLPGVKRWQIETHGIRFDSHSVAWSPDGKFIAYGDPGRGVRVVDAASRRLVRMLCGHEGGVRAVAWSPDGAWLASASTDKTVRLWRADGTPGPVLKGHHEQAKCLAWSPDSKRLASGGDWGDGTLRLWNVDGTAGPILRHDSAVEAVAWSPDGTTLASSDVAPRLVRLWKAADGMPLPPLGPFPHYAPALAWSPDSRRLAVSRGDFEKEKIAGWIWDVAQRKQEAALEYATNQITWLGWNKQGRLAAATNDGFVVFFDPQSGKSISSRSQGYWLHSASWSPDGRRIADASGQIVQVPKDGQIASSSSFVRMIDWKVACSPDGKRLAVSNGDKSVLTWLADGRPGPVLRGHEGIVCAVAWSADGKRLASASTDQTVRIWKLDGTVEEILKGHENEVYAVAWSPDGKWLASGSADQTIRLWRSDGTPGPILRGHAVNVTSLAWNRDGSWLASTSGDQTVRLWRADGRPGPVLRGHTTSGLQSVTWRPDGKQLASSGDWSNFTIRFWAPDGTPGLILKPKSRMVDLAWKPDGEWLASAGGDGAVWLWAADGSPGPIFKRHNGVVSSLSWSGDGKRLASVGRDRAIQASNDKGEPELTIVVLPDGRSAAFSAAGELLHGDAEAIEDQLAYLLEQSDGRIEVVRPSAFRADKSRRSPEDAAR